jgi:hypothetical protein
MKVLDVKNVVVGAALEKQLVEVMSNLPKMNAALQDEDTYDIETVRKMIVVEVRTKKRSATIGRLLGRFKTLLAAELEAEVR